MRLDVSTMVPLALIVNELITNILKHAEIVDEKLIIDIALFKNNKDQLVLKVKDSGAQYVDFDSSEGFGIKLIKTLAMKLEGEVQFRNKEGFLAEIIFNKYKLAS